jgi:hypothetical protein
MFFSHTARTSRSSKKRIDIFRCSRFILSFTPCSMAVKTGHALPLRLFNKLTLKYQPLAGQP